jgi:hypothetical protein
VLGIASSLLTKVYTPTLENSPTILINDGVIERFLNSASLFGAGVVSSSFLQATNKDVVAEIKRSDRLSFLVNMFYYLEDEII